MSSKISFLSVLFFLTQVAHAMDISGRVVDKRFAPIAGAQVCISGGTTCVSSGADGTFHLTGTSGVFHPGDRLAKNYSLDFMRGAFTLNAPEAVHARVEWFDARGSRIGSVSEVDLSKGRNALAAPARAGGGPLLLRLSTALFSATWKTILQSDAGGVAQGGAPQFAAVAKTSAPAGLDVSKSGFESTSYLPKAESETNDIILMGATGEKVELLFDGKTLAGWSPFQKTGPYPDSWDVMDSALHCKGNGRGTLNTDKDYGDYRVIFSVKHQYLPKAGRNGGDHQPCTLIFCYRTPFYDAAGGIQFQVPNGGHWDYRPGKNTGNPGNEFTSKGGGGLNNKVWNQCEILAHKATGTARMACCTLTGNGPCKGVENLDFKDQSAGRDGPFALQAHNANLEDEYKNISIETNPTVDDLITTK